MQVLLLLKSSDRIAHDICHAFDACTEAPAEPPEFHLALRKWIPLRPEREFRCFVKGHDLAGAAHHTHILSTINTKSPVIRDCLGLIFVPKRGSVKSYGNHWVADIIDEAKIS